MHEFWVPARRAVDLLERYGSHAVRYALCKRAHAELLATRARLLVVDQSRKENVDIPSCFWWAEGHSALDQDWTTGDFATWIDGRIQMRAFGVQFAFEGLRDMMPAEKGAQAFCDLSVASNSRWISAKSARRFMYERFGSNPNTAGAELIEQCRLGFVAARAVLMQLSGKGHLVASNPGQREWDIPEWFWLNFTDVDSSAQDWDKGVFSGKGRTPAGIQYMRLSGVHFERSALEGLLRDTDDSGSVNSTATANKGGRPRKDWWDDLWCAIWGDVYRGDFLPKTQAEIERRMLDWAEARRESVAESTVKPLARKMFAEMQREARN